jgi:hypothetical protein
VIRRAVTRRGSLLVCSILFFTSLAFGFHPILF